jgi:formate dehydrogenase subunit gamma
MQAYGVAAIGGTIVLLAFFFLLRGRIRIERGWSGWTLTRFGRIARLSHWLLALSFLVLALTGLNAVYGPYVLLPLLGDQMFAEVRIWSGWLHTAAAFAFMVALAIAFMVWIRYSLPGWRDIVWLAKGGGLLVAGVHAPAWKLNFAQKVLFWLVMLGGLSLSLSGLTLMFPGETTLLARTFAIVNGLGAYVALAPGLPTQLTPLQETSYALWWHGICALGLSAVVIVHVYFRTLGIEGAFSAMASGRVDANWARQHHSLWAEREISKIEDASAPPEAAIAHPSQPA